VIVPVIPTRGHIDPALDGILSELARGEDIISAELRNALYVAYAPRLHRILIRLWYRNLSEFGCDLEDLEQELFLIFVLLVERWSGSGSLSAYLHGALPWRLYDAARRLAPRDRPLGDQPVAASNNERANTDAEMVVLLEELALRLSRFDRDLLLWHVRDGKPLSQIAREQGTSPRTIRRAWLRLQRHVRLELAD
jgi:RNA polymerase sigma factor (sigma-70 family)